MDSLKKVSQQTLWQLIGKAASSLSTIIVLGAITRHYGESGTGVYTQALTYLSFFYLAGDFGLNAYVLPKIIQENGTEWRKLLGLRIVWSIVLIVLAVVILPFLPFKNDQFVKAVWIGSLAIFGSGLFVTGNAFFQSKLRYDLSLWVSAWDIFPIIIILLFLISINVPISSLLILHTVGWVLTGILALILVKRFVKNIEPIFDWNYMANVFKNAWPISLTLVLNVVYFRLDSFILTAVKSFAEVGVYNLAYQIFQSALVLPTFIMNGYYPLMLKELAESRGYFIRDLKRACLIMLGISVLGTITTLILSPIVIQIISGGKGFVGSVDSLRILSLGFPAYFVSSVLMWTLVSLKKYKQMLLVYLIGLLVNGVLNFVFIPQFSFIASSYITGVSEYLILILQILILYPAFKKA